MSNANGSSASGWDRLVWTRTAPRKRKKWGVTDDLGTRVVAYSTRVVTDYRVGTDSLMTIPTFKTYIVSVAPTTSAYS